MSQVTYNSEKVAKKKVRFTNDTGASVTLRVGYALCYDHAEVTIAQAYDVVRPATLNLKYFAGFLCEEYDGIVVADGAVVSVEIYIPTKYGQVVPVWSTEDHSANTALLEIVDASFIAVEGTTNKVCRTVQLAKRDVTNGVLLARVYGLSDPLA